MVSWNCAGAFHRKWEYVAAFEPDVLVIPEAACPERLSTGFKDAYPHLLWTGRLETKGLLVASRVKARIAACDFDRARFVLPVEIDGEHPAKVLAVWTQRDDMGSYTQHLAHAIEDLSPWLDSDTVVVGDFNANAIWDKDHRREVTHSRNVAELEQRGFRSMYHVQTGREQGEETDFTHAFRRNPHSLFHIDYCFAGSAVRERGCALEIREPAEWVALSDHSPLVIDIR